jgi:CheY-like chemotaxis protein
VEGELASNSNLVIEITDTGIGISPENMPRIFNAFEQGERSRTRMFGGLGLGLAISRAIVEQHGGSLVAQSEGTDKGTKLIMRLHAISAPPPRIPGPSVPSSPLTSRSSHALNILLVEDHADTGEQLTRLLKRAGHEVTWAGNLKEARQYLSNKEATRASSFDVLISDLGLPDGTGHDLMRDVAKLHPMPGIALSGYGMKDDIHSSMAAGFTRHITKPVDWQELKGVLQKIAVAGE